KNIISYGNDHINKINFKNNGFYTVYGNNAIGKTSIINIIKWGLFGDESNFKGRDILNNQALDGYIKIEFKIYDKICIITKNIKTNKNDRKDIEIIFDINDKKYIGNDAIFEINNLIGTYDDFELLSNISSNDFSIINLK